MTDSTSVEQARLLVRYGANVSGRTRQMWYALRPFSNLFSLSSKKVGLHINTHTGLDNCILLKAVTKYVTATRVRRTDRGIRAAQIVILTPILVVQDSAELNIRKTLQLQVIAKHWKSWKRM